jgi:hypothetical protein
MRLGPLKTLVKNKAVMARLEEQAQRAAGTPWDATPPCMSDPPPTSRRGRFAAPPTGRPRAWWLPDAPAAAEVPAPQAEQAAEEEALSAGEAEPAAHASQHASSGSHAPRSCGCSMRRARRAASLSIALARS